MELVRGEKRALFKTYKFALVHLSRKSGGTSIGKKNL
jgi:hypothetical protein